MLGTEVPEHCQEQQMQLLIVNTQNHLFTMILKLPEWNILLVTRLCQRQESGWEEWLHSIALCCLAWTHGDLSDDCRPSWGQEPCSLWRNDTPSHRFMEGSRERVQTSLGQLRWFKSCYVGWKNSTWHGKTIQQQNHCVVAQEKLNESLCALGT